jgi:signal transduction histidine kinase
VTVVVAGRGRGLLRRWTVVGPLARVAFSRHAALTLIAASCVPLAAVSIWLAASSDHLQHPVASALYSTYLAVAPILVGVYWLRRRPSSRFGWVLVLFGLVSWVVSWQAADWALPFDLGVLAEGPFTFLTFYLFLAFPRGRLETPIERLLMGGWAVVLGGFFLPWALGSPVIEGGAPLSACVRACPRNVLQVGSAPGLIETLGNWETYLGVVVTLAVLVVYALRLRSASRPRRRALVAVAASSLLFMPVFLVYHVSQWIFHVDASTLSVMAWVLVGARVVYPLGFLVALFQAELFAGVARGRLLEQLLARPSPDGWRDAVADALDDPMLELAYCDPDSGQYRAPSGSELTPPPPGGGRVWVPIDRDGRPVAAMAIDSALAEDPELVRAAASATVLAVEHGNLEGEVRDSRARILAAGGNERRRIERDIHDGAQQRLVALRIHLSLAGEHLGSPEERAMVERLGDEVDETIDELRSLAGGLYPQRLAETGLGTALRWASVHAAIPVQVETRGLRRHPEPIELAVYFSCLEAIQNAAKHAGREASATLRLDEDDRLLKFSVEDNGRGFEPRSVTPGMGLTNITGRISAAGGTVRIESSNGAGTRVSGQVPV